MESLQSLLPFSVIGLSRRQRNLLLACCAIGAGGYVSYRVYSSESLTRKRLQLYRLFSSLSSMLESAAQGSDCVGVLWKDLHSFLLSKEDEVPQSLKQLFKVGETREFQTSVALLCKSVTQGVLTSFSDQQAPVLQDGADYGSALFEELSARKGLRSIKSARATRKERRRKDSAAEVYAQKLKDAEEDNSSHDYSRGKLEQGNSAFLIEGEEGERRVREQDEEEVRKSWSGALAGESMAETSGSGGRRKSRSPMQNRERRGEGLPERLVGKMLSEAGRGFASAVVASATRSLVLSVLEGMQHMSKRDLNFSGETLLRTVCGDAKDSKDQQAKGREKDGVTSGDRVKKPTSSSVVSGSLQDWMINFLCSNKGKSLVADCIETFVGTAVSVYLDKTRDINIYEEFLSTVANDAHRDSVKDLLTSVCNGALETLVRTSVEVLTVDSSSSAPQSKLSEDSVQLGPGAHGDVRRLTFSLGKSSCFNQSNNLDAGDMRECGTSEGGNDQFAPESPPPWSPESHDSESLNLSGHRSTRIAFDHSPQSEEKMPANDLEKAESPNLSSPSYRQIIRRPVPMKSSERSQGWVEGFSRTLAVPSNRALVLDVAGTVTAEAVRSTIDVMLSKVSHTLRGKPEKLSVSESKPGTSNVLRVISKTGELAQATASKALVAMTMCLAICLHTLLGQSNILEHS